METRGERQVRESLEKAGIRADIRRFPESTRNSDLAARSLGVETGQIAKTLLFLADGSPVVVVVSGDRRVDMKKVRALGHGRKVRLAGPEEVAAHTGFPVGAVSPAPLPPGIPVYLDRSLRRFGVVHPAAGSANSMFSATPDELLALTGGREADLARDDG